MSAPWLVHDEIALEYTYCLTLVDTQFPLESVYLKLLGSTAQRLHLAMTEFLIEWGEMRS